MPFRRHSASEPVDAPWALSPERYVEALYELCLGRPADPEGLAAWTAELRANGDPTVVLDGLMSSDEARSRRSAPDQEGPERDRLAERAAAGLTRRPRIVDVGAQSLGEGTHPYSPLAERMPVDIVGFDPLDERLDERRTTESNEGSMQLIPAAIGDGERHTLYINDDDATSSLYPLNMEHNAQFDHLSTLSTVRTMQVQTSRLDEALPPGPIDFLKLDVQGAELMVIRGGPTSLARSAVVHCEVEFSPIYEGQPLYPDVHAELAQFGFELIDLLIPHRYHYLAREQATPDRLIWADAVFFRRTDEPEALLMQALIGAVVYGKLSLAAHLLSRVPVEDLGSSGE